MCGTENELALIIIIKITICGRRGMHSCVGGFSLKKKYMYIHSVFYVNSKSTENILNIVICFVYRARKIRVTRNCSIPSNLYAPNRGFDIDREVQAMNWVRTRQPLFIFSQCMSESSKAMTMY